MSCGCCGGPSRARTADSDCIAFSGTGRVGDPLVASPIIPAGAVVPHPLAPGFLPDTINGLVCTPTGFMAPQPGFPNASQASLPFGSNPDIIANTGGPIPWGPVGNDTLLNPNSDRFMWVQRATQSPLVQFVLEPGATATVGYILDPLGLALYFETWRMTNASGAAVETYGMYPQTFVDVALLLPAASSSVDFQMFVSLAGATGVSSVTSFGQSGMRTTQFGVPI
jgi:hypothetical protein